MLILDPDCKTKSGHYFQTDRTLISLFGDFECHLAVRRQAYKHVDFGSGVNVIRWSAPKGILSRIPGIFSKTKLKDQEKEIDRIKRDTAAICRIIGNLGLSRSDMVIVHTADRIISALSDTIGSIQEAGSPTFIIRFVDMEPIGQGIDDAHVKLANHQKSRSNVLVFSETDETAKSMIDQYGYSLVRPWIMPLASQATSKMANPEDPDNEFVVGFLGGKRAEQQPGYIPELARLLISSRDRWPVEKISFLVQAVSPGIKQTEEYDAAMKALNMVLGEEAGDHFSVEMLPSIMDETEFDLAVARSHLLVLPYDVRKYGNRGSGLVIDAALSGTPIAVPKGFAMRRWTELAGAPVCNDVNEYVGAIMEVAGNYQSYLKCAAHGGDQLRSFIDQQIVDIRSLGGEASPDQ